MVLPVLDYKGFFFFLLHLTTTMEAVCHMLGTVPGNRPRGKDSKKVTGQPPRRDQVPQSKILQGPESCQQLGERAPTQILKRNPTTHLIMMPQ